MLAILVIGSRDRRHELFVWGVRDYKLSAWLGALNPFIYYVILFRAYDRLPAQEVQPLNQVWPLVLAVMSTVILRQRPRRCDYIGMVVSFLGAMVIATRGDVLGFRISDPIGVALALGSSVIWALYWLSAAKDTRDAVVRLFVSTVFGGAYITGWVVVTGQADFPVGPGLYGICWVGLFEMGLAFLAWLMALRLSDSAARVGGLVFLVPFISLCLIHVLVGEPILPSTPIGLVTIILGLVIQRSGDTFRRSAT